VNHLSRFVDLRTPCQVAGVEQTKKLKKDAKASHEATRTGT
jgi:hypothetical protein